MKRKENSNQKENERVRKGTKENESSLQDDPGVEEEGSP